MAGWLAGEVCRVSGVGKTDEVCRICEVGIAKQSGCARIQAVILRDMGLRGPKPILAPQPIAPQAHLGARRFVPAERGAGEFLALNAELSQQWPVITEMKPAPDDADDWKEVSGKLEHLQR